MRMSARVSIALAALAVLLALAVGTLLASLPRLAQSEAVRARLTAAARDATGSDVRWQTVSFGLLPPRLVVERPEVTVPGRAGPPLLEADSVALRFAVLPLLARTLVIDSLRLEGVTARLVRTRSGIELPRPAAKPAGEPRAEPAAKEEAAGLALAVRELELSRSTLVVEDRSVSPSVTWELTELDARARGRALDAPLDVEVSGRLASGGRLRVEGTAQLDGSIDLRADLDGLRLDPIAPYLGRGRRMAGSVSGTVRAKGPATAPTAVRADLDLADADVALEDVVMRGPLSVKADLQGDLAAPTGSFEIDASGAELSYGEAFTKPAGTPATASGKLVPQPGGGLGVDDMRVRIRNLDANARVRLGKATRIELDAEPFDLAGWEALVPALADAKPAGKVGLDGLVVATPPLAVQGRVRLDPVRIQSEAGAAITLRGALEGTGPAVSGRGLELGIGDQVVPLDLEVSDLATAPRYRIRARGQGADSNALVAALAGRKDVLSGPLDLEADLTGPAGGERPVLETMTGRTRLDIKNGRLRGVSLLRGTFERLGTFGEAALLAGELRGGKTLQRFYGDEFEEISGSFDIRAGSARTEDLRLVYRQYRADLRGSLGLGDGSLDLTGQLTVGEEVDAALERVARDGGTAAAPREKVIPLARVTGTVASPRIDLSPQAALAFASSYAVGRERGRIEQKIDERLGEGAGREVFDALEGLLGGRKPKPDPP